MTRNCGSYLLPVALLMIFVSSCSANDDDFPIPDPPSTVFVDNLNGDVIGLVVYGQSQGAGSFGGEIVSTKKYFDNIKMFAGGVRAKDALYLNQNKISWIIRKGEPQVSELVNYNSTLSSKDAAVLDKHYSDVVDLQERIQTYSWYRGEGASYIPNAKGTVHSIHADSETPLTGICQGLDELLMQENGFTHAKQLQKVVTFFATCPSHGGASIRSLFPLDRWGTLHSSTGESDAANLNYCELLMLDTKKATEYYAAKGQRYNVNAVFFYHEHTTHSLEYVAVSELLKLFTLIDARIKAITGQENDVKFILSQSAHETQGRTEGRIGLMTKQPEFNAEQRVVIDQALPGLVGVEEYDVNNVIVGQPMYNYPVGGDGLHMSSLGRKLHGAAMAVAFKHWTERETKWMPIHPVSHESQTLTVNGMERYELKLKMHVEYSPLVLDENAIHGTNANPNAKARGDRYGFVFYDGDEAKDIIESVEIMGDDVVRIVCKSDFAGLSLHYAIDEARNPDGDWGNLPQRPNGNLRDSRGEKLSIRINDHTKPQPIHNWCMGFVYDL